MRNWTQLSKFLSYVLRHDPQSVGLELDAGGWVEVEELLEAVRRNGYDLDDRTRLEEVVERGDKKRFSFSAEGRRIRANDGHSVEVDLGLRPRSPPEQLCHGTARRFLEAIRTEGLRPMSRQWVHLNEDDEEGRRRAREVGARHGTPVLLQVVTALLESPCFRSESGLWLVDRVSPEALR